jgi:pyruvate formate lyase activating enzyme
MTLPFAGVVSSIAVDPVEKKPLYHYYPGRSILSVGFLGCNLRCPFCQNWQISQSTRNAAYTLTPSDVVALAEQHNSFGIAYTYNEPIIHAEYIMETAQCARSRSLKNVLVTAGHVLDDARRDVFGVMDAVNIDLKSFSAEYYQSVIKGRLDAVLESIRYAVGRIHTEVTTLLIPGENDSPEEIDGIADFLASINPDIPLHISAYHPAYRYKTRATPESTIHTAVARAGTYLRYVYPGNMKNETVTACPKCGAVLVRRSGYSVDTSGIRDGKCSACGSRIPVITDAAT